MAEKRTVQVQEDPFGDITAYTRPKAPVSEAAANARLWTSANTSTEPKYDIAAPRLPPQAVNAGPALTILKRPSSAASDRSAERNASPSGAMDKKSLKERERAYEEAKKRIYADSVANDNKAKGSSSASNDKKTQSKSTNTTSKAKRSSSNRLGSTPFETANDLARIARMLAGTR